MSHTNLLTTLNELKASGAFPQRLLLRDASVSATIEMDVQQMDKLSVELTMLRVSPEQAPKENLRDRATLLANRVTGLMEKLAAIEIDEGRGEALLRSDTPAAHDASRTYYELLVQKTGVTTLNRFQGSMIKTGRKETGFTLTREALAKLIRDLAQ